MTANHVLLCSWDIEKMHMTILINEKNYCEEKMKFMSSSNNFKKLSGNTLNKYVVYILYFFLALGEDTKMLSTASPCIQILNMLRELS